jgi:hypothetical protein
MPDLGCSAIGWMELRVIKLARILDIFDCTLFFVKNTQHSGSYVRYQVFTAASMKVITLMM